MYNLLVAIGITNQRETTVIWDRETGQPLYNAVGSYSSLIYYFLFFLM